MLYLIDGYNVTKADPATRGLPLERQRDELVARLRSRGSVVLGPGRIVVVFDGGGASGVSVAVGAAPVEVRFSRGEKADDVLVRLAASAGETVVLVSSDRGLASRVLADGGSNVEVRERELLFDAAGRGSRRNAKRGRYPVTGLGVPPGGNSITRELEKLWLDDVTTGAQDPSADEE